MSATLAVPSLIGKHLMLERLRPEHLGGLLAAARSPEIWAWSSEAPRTPSMMRRWIRRGIDAYKQGDECTFVVLLRATRRVVGSTSYLRIDPRNRTTDIGRTWYEPGSWGTVVNPECKLLLLQHAFEDWRAMRVQFTVDALNLHSVAAIRKLGAKYEGTLRSHRIRHDGTIRDTKLFSILDTEWPSVKRALKKRVVGWEESTVRAGP